MSRRTPSPRAARGGAFLLLVLALAGCGAFRQDPNVAARNSALGIQPSSLTPGTQVGPNGLLNNGLLPPQFGNDL